jgi:dihydroorotase-like cyclic amidohydrolase
VFTKDKIISQTENSPFVGKELKGSIVGIINNGNLACRE